MMVKRKYLAVKTLAKAALAISGRMNQKIVINTGKVISFLGLINIRYILVKIISIRTGTEM